MNEPKTRTRTHRGVAYTISLAHEAAECLPWQSEVELQRLADNIVANGQNYRIVRLPDGTIVDGRNRELACRIAGVEPEYTTVEMTADEIADIVESRNLVRRFLTESQRALIAAALADFRARHAPKASASRDADATQTPPTQVEAAAAQDVSRSSVQRAAKVLREAPELADAVRDGELDVMTAAKTAALPAETRRRIAAAPDKKKAAEKAFKRAGKPKDETPAPAPQGDVENPPLDPRFMPNAEEAADLAGQFQNWVARLRAFKAELRAALGDDHVVGRRIDVADMLAQVGQMVETLDKNVPDCVCPACCGTGSDESGAGCKFCDGYGVVDRHHHAGLKATWKHTRARLAALTAAAENPRAA